jgi:hypothetical protein
MLLDDLQLHFETMVLSVQLDDLSLQDKLSLQEELWLDLLKDEVKFG